jgi:rhamnosyltransferase subunit B
VRVFIAAIGSGGDLNPMIAIGVSLRDRGHEVILMAGEWQAEVVRQAGLPFACVLDQDDFDRFTERAGTSDNPGGAWVAFFLDAVLPAMDRVYRYVEQYAAPGRSLLLGSSHAIGLRLAEEKLGIPLVTTRLQPQAAKDDDSEGEAMFDRLFTPQIDRYRRRIGLPPLAEPFHRWLVKLDRAVSLFPPWFATPGIDALEQGRMIDFILFNGAASATPPRELDLFLAEDRLPIVFTHGTGNEHVETFFDTAEAACALIDRRAILLSPLQQGESSRKSPRSLQLGYHPLDELLPYVAAIVHHGGIGTCAQALRAGTPQLVIPLGFDQQQNAHRIERLGAGIQMGVPDVTPEALAERLRAMLDNEVLLAQCKTISRRFPHRDTITQCVDIILAMAMPASVALGDAP